MQIQIGPLNVDHSRAQTAIGKSGANTTHILTAGESQSPTAMQPFTDLRKAIQHGTRKIWFNKNVKSKRYQEGVRADALKALDKAAKDYRDTLREEDEHDGNSTICSDSCSDAPDHAEDDGIPDGAFVPSPCEIYDSLSEPGICF